jgi:thiol-disulfide isomerase/thioredoxin
LNEVKGNEGAGGEGQVTPGLAEKSVVRRLKVLAGALVAVGLVMGLYLVNRYWIAPAVTGQVKNASEHPFAPVFSLSDLSGRPLSLSDYKGKVVVLDFWATWCEPCRIEIPGFVEMQNRYGSQGLAMIGISMDDGPGPVVEFYRQFKMNYPVALGNERLGELYGGIFGLPTTFLIGRDGRIYAKHVGATDPARIEEEVKQLLAMSPAAEAVEFKRAGGIRAVERVELGDPEEIDSEVPGVNLSKLTPEQKAAFKKILESQRCPCGCNLSLLKCRQVDRQCGVSRRLAREQLELFLKSRT